MNYNIDTICDSFWKVDDGTGVEKTVYLLGDSLYVSDGTNVIIAKDEDDIENIIDNKALETMNDDFHEYYINGYLVDHTVPCEQVTIKDIDLPLYKRNSDSEAIYAAGCYCIKYDTGWKHGRSIMLSTLMKYEYLGPFHTLEKAYYELRKVRKNKT